jgi:hypothetical protein
MIEAVAMNFWDKNYHPEFGLIEDAEECRLLLRPQRAGRIVRAGAWRDGPGYSIRESKWNVKPGWNIHDTRAQAAQAEWQAKWEAENLNAITQDDRDRT